MITQNQLKEALSYNQETGLFVWKKQLGSRGKAGNVAGTLHIKGYIDIIINKRSYKAHRLAWLYVYGEWPKDQIDHINHIRDDNRSDNLREATNQENQKNASKRKDNISGVTGVYWAKDRELWRAKINKISLGSFSDKFEAVCARMSANNRHGFHENHGI